MEHLPYLLLPRNLLHKDLIRIIDVTFCNGFKYLILSIWRLLYVRTLNAPQARRSKSWLELDTLFEEMKPRGSSSNGHHLMCNNINVTFLYQLGENSRSNTRAIYFSILSCKIQMSLHYMHSLRLVITVQSFYKFIVEFQILSSWAFELLPCPFSDRSKICVS